MSDHWHKHFHGRILNSYSKLPVELRGVAYTLLDMIYDAGGPLADSDSVLAAKMLCSLRKWKTYKSELLRLEKIYLTDDGRITHPVCKELLDRRLKQAEFGAAGGRKKAENQKKRQDFKGRDLGTLQGSLLAKEKVEVREEPVGSSSEAKASGADAPFDLKKFFFDTVKDCFERAGDSREHGGSMAAKVWNRHPDQAESVLDAMLVENPSEPSRWFGGVFKRLAQGAQIVAAQPSAPTREIVYDADGHPRAVRNLTTGVETPIGRAA